MQVKMLVRLATLGMLSVVVALVNNVYAASLSIQYEHGFQGSISDNSTVVQTNLPFWGSQKQGWISLLDARLKKSDTGLDEINLGLVYRHRMDRQYWLGIYTFADYMRITKGQGFWQWVLGLESLHPKHFARLNIYLPQTKTIWLQQYPQYIDFNREMMLVARDGVKADKGIDFEFGPRFQGDKQVVSLSAGGALFQEDDILRRSMHVGASVKTIPTHYLPSFEVYTKIVKEQHIKPFSLQLGLKVYFYTGSSGSKEALDVVYTPIDRDINVVTRTVKEQYVSNLTLEEDAQDAPLQEVSWRSDFSDINQVQQDWDIELWPAGQFNQEQETYTRDSRNLFTQDGSLHIKGIQDDDGRITSARLTTQFHKYFGYGHLVVRAKLPTQQGTWPAIWLLGQSINEKGWPASGEIDIMEHVNNESTVKGSAHDANHYWSGEHKNKEYDHQVDNLDQAHDYGLTWTPDYLEWSVDGHAYGRLYKTEYVQPGETWWAYDDPQFLILNLALGGVWPGPVPADFKSGEMVVESVQYQALDQDRYAQGLTN